MNAHEQGRYDRQERLPEIGPEGQARLAAAHAVIIGCGALGSVSSEWLARAGVGTLTLIDRDLVEPTNLHRQSLYAEADVGLPKAEAARARLERINSEIAIRAHVADFSPGNALELLAGEPPVSVLVDGTDNFETRFLLNDLAVREGLPYIYAGVIGTGGMVAAFTPGGDGWPNPCLRCVFDAPPPTGSQPTCETAGVLGPAVGVVASYQAALVVRTLVGDAPQPAMTEIDPWAGRLRTVTLAAAKGAGCRCCGERVFEHLDAPGEPARALCGRDAVQVSPAVRTGAVDLAALGDKLAGVGTFHANAWFLQGTLDEPGPGGQPLGVTIFADGRAIIEGTDDVARARSVYARYVGV